MVKYPRCIGRRIITVSTWDNHYIRHVQYLCLPAQKKNAWSKRNTREQKDALSTWTQMVSALLHKSGKNTWLKLAVQLQFQADQIRAFMKHDNPCLAMFEMLFSEYIKNIRDGTFYVWNALQKMGREDAVEAIQDAIRIPTETSSDGLERLSLPNDELRLPKIFISYHWDSREEVISLYRRLRELGFECWMDVEQLNVGDCIDEKISDGIRACRVILPCLSKGYTKSLLCRRELSIAKDWRKIIIPLHLTEKLSIPGSMKLLLASLQSIQCSEASEQSWMNDDSEFVPPELIEKLKEETQVSLPEWADEVSSLLQDDSVWYHFGLQLGFQMHELKTMSQDENPCLAVLNKHFMNHLDDFNTATEQVMVALDKTEQYTALDVIQRAIDPERAEEPNTKVKRIEPEPVTVVDKTQNNLPKWVDDVNENLQSERANHAWMQLAFQLEFDADKMKACSADENPCLAVLKTFFSDYEDNIRDGTHHLRNALERMGCKKTTDVMDEALKIPTETSNVALRQLSLPNKKLRLPNIFISYHWDSRQEVVSLHQRLCELGFECWLDVDQLKGADCIDDKITDGIRGSRVLLSCLSEGYTQSQSCRRELSIAKDLRKVIIPLNLTEKLSLSGSMKMMLDSSASINCSEASKHSWIDGMEFQPSDLIERLKGYMQVILPGWAKDVATNLKDDSKWMHLGLQLGFEMRELKTLSLDENPCLAVFNEHFKNYFDDFRTATKYIMTALENIKQTEALDIIQKDKDKHKKVVKRLPNKDPVIQAQATTDDTEILPSWTGEVSDMLFKGERNSWIRLALELQFHHDKIKYCLNEKNPCLAIFEVLFKEYKKDIRDGTFYAWDALQRLEREDAVEMIQKAIAPPIEENSDCVKLKKLSPERGKLLPKIFISYHWNSQKEILSLFQSLSDLGYDCWMDVKRLNVGDCIDEKITSGIRDCRVLLSCLTKTYIESNMCRQEVSIAKDLRKTIIPLNLDEGGVSLPGSLELTLGALRTIDCSEDFRNDWRRDVEFSPRTLLDTLAKYNEILLPAWTNTVCALLKDDDSWMHLGLQLQIKLPLLKKFSHEENPCRAVFDKHFTNYYEDFRTGTSLVFKALENIERIEACDVIQRNIDPPRSEAFIDLNPLKGALPIDNKMSPDIFISYEWSSQSRILPLYHSLTALGFHCWIDVKHVRSREKIKDKIDDAIKNCKVFLLCLTEEYMNTEICRVENEEAEKAGKPIILLEIGGIKSAESDKYRDCIKCQTACENNWRERMDFAPQKLQDILSELVLNKGPSWKDELAASLYKIDKDGWKKLVEKIELDDEKTALCKDEKNPYSKILELFFAAEKNTFDMREATFNLFKHLKDSEIDFTKLEDMKSDDDGSEIIKGIIEKENKKTVEKDGTEKSKEAIIEETADEESLIPDGKPEVFISYQWGSQKEILSLRKWLKKFGMTCWLDVEQISIGDVLFEKIYDGIKHCKLFLSCVTTKYMESDNCRRELSLAAEYKKEILPLKLEKFGNKWTGSAAFILASLTYQDCWEASRNNWVDPNDENKFALPQLKTQLSEKLKTKMDTEEQNAEQPQEELPENPTETPPEKPKKSKFCTVL